MLFGFPSTIPTTSQSDFGLGWPQVDDLPVAHLDAEHKAAMFKLCSDLENPVMPSDSDRDDEGEVQEWRKQNCPGAETEAANGVDEAEDE